MAEQRYEREIDELLKRLEGEHRGPVPFRPRRRPRPWAALGGRLRELLATHSAVERLMMLAVALLLGTFLLNFFDPRAARGSGLAAVLCFVAALGLSVWAGARGRGPDYRWGGQAYGVGGRRLDWDLLRWRLAAWLKRFRR